MNSHRESEDRQPRDRHESRGSESESENNNALIAAYSDWRRKELIFKLDYKSRKLDKLNRELDRQEKIIKDLEDTNSRSNNIIRDLENSNSTNNITTNDTRSVNKKKHICIRCGHFQQHKGKHCPHYKYFSVKPCNICRFYHNDEDCNRDNNKSHH